MKPQIKRSEARGFALVVALSLMILLTVVAVGLLALSSISLRSASQGQAMATARANARMALMLALGDIQKTLGPDKAISANSRILAEAVGKPNVTGAWESWNFNPSEGAPAYATEKQNRFRRWLVSSPDPSLLGNRDFVTSGWSGKTVELVGQKALGGNASAAERSVAGYVPVAKNNKVDGRFAWHVSDESLKARINLYRKPSDGTGAYWEKRSLLAGQRPAASVVKGLAGGSMDFLPTDLSAADFTDAEISASKAIDLDQADLFATAGRIREFRNDVTPYSLGVLADVRNGGLKQDLTSVFEFNTSTTTGLLPPNFNATGKTRLYQSTHGITGISDPNWSTLASYYNTFRGITTADTVPTFNQRPGEAISMTRPPVVPTRFFPGPVITKVEALLSYVTRDSHSNWVASLKSVDPTMVYMGHLVYTPQVTLHNPYNINISFERMVVNIRNVPVAFNVYINDVPQSSTLVPLTDMFVNAGQRGEKQFFMEIGNWSSPTGSSVSGPVVLKPGQTLVCGPYLNPAASFSNNQGSYFFDWENNLTGTETAPIKARPGYFGRCFGFDVDWITPIHDSPTGNLSSGQQTDGNRGVLGVRPTDRIHILYGVKRPSKGLDTAFQVSAKVVVSGRTYEYGGLEFKYQDQNTLSKFFPETYRYPTSGYMTQATTYVPNTEPLSNHARAKTFGIFSAYARTTNGGVYETGSRTPVAGAQNALRDGRLAGKPFLYHNPARTLVSINLGSEKPSGQSHELNFQPLPGHVDDILETDANNRTNYLTGNTTTKGIKSGSYLELPTGPMQTIADFRRSNALSSPFLPSFVQPVGNSSVSPLMTTDKVVQRDSDIASYDLLDHSVLANHALYDQFYFSTFATKPDASGRAVVESGVTMTPDNVFERFLTGKTKLPSQSFLPYIPSGKTSTAAKLELFSAAKPVGDAYLKAAEYQLIQGAFNVNSTSVQAWKAVLASTKGTKAVTLWGKNSALEMVATSGTPVMSMSMVNGGVAGGAGGAGVDAAKIDNVRTNEWNGFRSLDDAQLELLAQKIVEQVRLRGPFLSMSEFVNRQIGPDSPITRTGALEAAIEAAGLNSQIFSSADSRQVPITSDDISNPNLYRYNTPAVVTGNPAAGAPGWISQGDLMRILEPSATVRSDTFVIRVCGEAMTGEVVTARAFAEAVVQRVPEFLDSADRPSTNLASLTSNANKTFGRRFTVVSFRWLSTNEI